MAYVSWNLLDFFVASRIYPKLYLRSQMYFNFKIYVLDVLFWPIWDICLKEFDDIHQKVNSFWILTSNQNSSGLHH